MKFLCILLILGLIGFGVYKVGQHVAGLLKTKVISGTLVRYESAQPKDAHELKNMYAPVIVYSFGDKTYEEKSTVLVSSPDERRIGQKVAIAVNPLRPQEVRILETQNIHSFGWLKSLGPLLLLGRLLLLIVVLLPGVFGGWILHSRITFFKTAVIVPGKVVKFETHVSKGKDDRGRKTRTTMYTPVIEYTYQGETRTIKNNWSSSDRDAESRPFKIGINPKDPQDVRIFLRREYILAGLLVLFSITLVFAVLGVEVLYRLSLLAFILALVGTLIGTFANLIFKIDILEKLHLFGD